MMTAGCTHTGPSPIGNKTAWGQPVAPIQALAVKQQVFLMTAGRTHAGPLSVNTHTGWSLCSTVQLKDSTSTRTGSKSNTTCQLKDNWLYSYRLITIMQNVSLRTAGSTHRGPLPFGNKTAWGELAALIQALAVIQQINLMTASRTHADPLSSDNKSA